MNYFKQCLIALVIMAGILPISTHAHTPRGVRMTGVVKSVDVPTRIVVFHRDGDAAPRSFRWVNATSFYHDAANTSPTALRRGMRVEVSMHDPFFGPDVVTRIKLLPLVIEIST